MRIEKLTENKIRFILNMDDLKAKNIDFHSFMSNSIESQDLFLDMLEQAEEEIGFKTDNYKLIIEAVATSDGNFILTVTRIAEDIPDKGKIINQKANNTLPSKALSIYSFKSFDDFSKFCTYISTILSPTVNSRLKNSSLYLLDSTYYFILKNIRMNIKDYNCFCSAIAEFATHIKNADLIERKIKEYGKLIIENSAVSTSLKYFK